ncbi:MAG: LytTR family DNA-binding domain-containing protein [Micropepsaceae bacterium]
MRTALLAIVPGILCALLGPLGTFEASLTQRFLFWVPSMAIGAVAGMFTTVAADRVAYLTARPWLKIATITTIITAIMTGVVLLNSRLAFGPNAVRLSLTLVFYVWVITLAMSAIGTLNYERNRRIAAASPVPLEPGVQPQAAPLTARLPVRLQDHPILALEAEDHYVRVHTPAGSELILLRLSDAAKEMGGQPGARTHRSWWVARSAVKSVNRLEGRMSLVLVNGVEAPVSRSYASELREAGWLDS